MARKAGEKKQELRKNITIITAFKHETVSKRTKTKQPSSGRYTYTHTNYDNEDHLLIL